MKLISIILPVYNVEKYIVKSIQSVLNQSYTEFELLVINDGSPDNSIEIVKQFIDPRIKIFHKENGGLSDARNFGLERARGEYIYFMDSDDWIEPNLLEDCIKVLERDQLDLVIFGYIQDNENEEGELVSSRTVLPANDKICKSDSNITISNHLLGILGYVWNKVYKRSLLVDNTITFEKGTSVVEDIIFNSQVYLKVNELNFINKGLYHYLNRPVVSLIKQFHFNSFELYVRKKQYLEQFFTNWGIENINEILASIIIQGIRYSIHNMFSYRNNLDYKEKQAYIRRIVTNTETKSYVKFYEPKSLKDMVYKLLIKCENSTLLTFIASKIK